MFYLVRKLGAGAGGEAHDNEYDTAALTVGADASSNVLLEQWRGGVRFTARGAGTASFSCRRQPLALNGATVAKGQVVPGDSLQLGPYQLTVIVPPAGFDFALELTAPDSSGKDYSALPLTLEQTGWSVRFWSVTLFVLVLATGLLIPALGLLSPDLQSVLRESHLPDDGQWLSGPLAGAHRSADIGNDCQVCHQQPFVMVEDNSCLACHRAVTGHSLGPEHSSPPDESSGATRRCAACHREHNEPAYLVRRDVGLCLDCHRDGIVAPATSAMPGQELAAAVQGFGGNKHPEFQLALLQPQGLGGALGWQLSRPRDARVNLRESSGLKFTHNIHMDAKKVQLESTGKGLQCSSCHQLQDDGEHFAALTMDGQCRSCHGLVFDVFEPELELPHGDLRAAFVALEAHFIREFTDPDLRRQRASIHPRRVPGRRTAAASCSGTGLECGRAEAAKEAQFQFADSGCVTCHEVVDSGNTSASASAIDRWYVQPVKISNDWYPFARFDHRSHLSLAAQNSDQLCLGCHKVANSDHASDIAIPGLQQCLQCHDDTKNHAVELDCVSCHDYHLNTSPMWHSVDTAGAVPAIVPVAPPVTLPVTLPVNPPQGAAQ